MGTAAECLLSLALLKSSSQCPPQGRAVTPMSLMKKLSLTGVESFVPHRHHGRKRQSQGLGTGLAAVRTQAYLAVLLHTWLGERGGQDREAIEPIINKPGEVGIVTQVLQTRKLMWLRFGESSDPGHTASKCHGSIQRTLGSLADWEVGGGSREKGGQRRTDFPFLGHDSHRPQPASPTLLSCSFTW